MILALPGFPSTLQDEHMKDTSGWKKIGITTINYKNTTDQIYVLESDRYTSVKFTVADLPVDIIDLEIFYETGDKQDIRVNLELTAPGESRPIELSGGERKLTKISFEYKPLAEKNGKKAVIELWGLKTKTTP